MLEAAVIVNLESENTFLVKFSGTSGEHFWIPFHGEEIVSVFVIGPTRALAVSRSSGQQTQIATFDLEQGKTSEITTVDLVNVRYCFLNEEKSYLLLFGYGSLIMVHVATMESKVLRASVQIEDCSTQSIGPKVGTSNKNTCFVEAHEPITECSDGTLLMGWERSLPEFCDAGALFFDPRSETFKAKTLSDDYKPDLDDTARWFSPDGRYCLRLPRKTHIGSRKSEGGIEYTELWDISEAPRLVGKIDHTLGGRAEAAVWGESSENLWLLLKAHIVLRVDVSGKKSYVPTIIERWASKEDPFETLRDLEAGMPAWVEHAKKSIFLDGPEKLRVNLAGVGSVTIPVGHERARSLLRKKPHFVKAATDNFAPVERGEDIAAKRYVRSFSLVSVTLVDETDASICDAMNNIAQRIETDINGLIWRNSLSISYNSEGREILQNDLLESLICENRVAVVPALVNLIDTFIDSDPPYGLRQNSGQTFLPAFYLELRTVLLLDATQTDLLRKYFLASSSDHQRHVEAELIPELFDRKHFSAEAVIALKIFLLMHYVLDGSIHDFGSIIIDEACDILEPDNLSEVIAREIDWFETEARPHLVSEFDEVFVGRAGYRKALTERLKL